MSKTKTGFNAIGGALSGPLGSNVVGGLTGPLGVKGVSGGLTGPLLGNSSALKNSKLPRSLDNASVWQSLDNILTGNLDYKRSIESAIRAEQVSAREAEKTRRWQEEMSSSAYSRAIADLKRNGINPYAIGYFSPASTPAGATGSAYNTSPHSAAANALGTLGLIERAYDNIKRRQIDEKNSLIRLLDVLFD